MNKSIFCEQNIHTVTKNVKNLSDNHDKIVEFDTLLQDMDSLNANRRIYPSSLMIPAVNKYMMDVNQKKCVGELDHPTIKDPKKELSRLTTVLYEKTSHVFLKIWVEGKDIWGRVRTTRTVHGNNLAGLVLDGIPVGFSLRAFGNHDVVNAPDGKPAMKIKEPFLLITWDAVAKPSHSRARMYNDVVTESLNITLESLNSNNELINPLFENIDVLITDNKFKNNGIYYGDMIKSLTENVYENTTEQKLSTTKELFNKYLKI